MAALTATSLEALKEYAKRKSSEKIDAIYKIIILLAIRAYFFLDIMI
jgi:hypothetical protein